MGRKGHLIIISAPSGAGKTSVIHRFLSKHPNMVHSVSCTTRPMRKGEVDGKDYRFINEDEFRRMIQNGGFAEWAEVHDCLYGTPKDPLDKALEDGVDVLLDLDVVGGMNLKKLYGDQAVSIFLVPPTLGELKRRLYRRGTDSSEVKALRMKNALKELKYKDEYDHQVVNDVLDDACKEIERILNL